MASDAPQSLSDGLPPVTPPSGRYIAQLFLVPGLIVTGAVVIGLFLHGFGQMFSNPEAPEHFLAKLDSTNEDVRWRGASDLAQLLERKESVALRNNVKFALDLCERWRTAFNDLKAAEKTVAERIATSSEKDKAKLWRQTDSKRNAVVFLTSALADFNVPVGAPLLCELAERDNSPDAQGAIHLRRMAVFNLGNMGENSKEFVRLPEEKQQKVIRELEREAVGNSERAVWARTGLHYLTRNQRMAGDCARTLAALLSASPMLAITQAALSTPPRTGVVLVDRSLAKCARAEDWELRTHVAFVLRFWDGDLVEPTLLLLARDTGHGSLLQSNLDK